MKRSATGCLNRVGVLSNRFEVVSEFAENRYETIATIERRKSCALWPGYWCGGQEIYSVDQTTNSKRESVGRIQVSSERSAFIYKVIVGSKEQKSKSTFRIVQAKSYDPGAKLFVTSYTSKKLVSAGEMELIDVG